MGGRWQCVVSWVVYLAHYSNSETKLSSCLNECQCLSIAFKVKAINKESLTVNYDSTLALVCNIQYSTLHVENRKRNKE